ncbi:MAG: HD domain-containing protein [Gaiellales bacterium]
MGLELGERVGQAVAFAVEAHGGQLRKGTNVPYVSHLLAVASLVLESGGGEDELIAALLHDAVEDRGVPIAAIEEQLGRRVASIVAEVSEERGAGERPWCERKRTYLAHVAQASHEALRVSIADKLHNARCLLADYRSQGEALWERFNPDADTLWYYRAFLHEARLRAEDQRLEPQLDELERTVSSLQEQVALAAHPLDDSYWLRPGRLLVGEYPFAADPTLGRRFLRRLSWSGIDLFLDLTEEGEYGLTAYAPIIAAGAHRCGEHPIAGHVRFPIPDSTAPEREELRTILDAIDVGLAEGRTIYLHCFGGVGRSGTVAAAWLVRHGSSPEAALARIAELRRGTPDGHRESPETFEQLRLVLTWNEGE